MSEKTIRKAMKLVEQAMRYEVRYMQKGNYLNYRRAMGRLNSAYLTVYPSQS